MVKKNESSYLKRFDTLRSLIKTTGNRKYADEVIQLYKDGKVTNRTADNIIIGLASGKRSIEKAITKLAGFRGKQSQKGKLKTEYANFIKAERSKALYYVNGEFTREKWWYNKDGSKTDIYEFNDMRGTSFRTTSEQDAIRLYKTYIIQIYTYETDYDGQMVKFFRNIEVTKMESDKYQVPIKDQPMKAVRPLQYAFIPSTEEFNRGEETCAIDIIVGMYSSYIKTITRDYVLSLFTAFHQCLYFKENYESWNVKDGVTPAMIKMFCEKHDISVYGFDLLKTCFSKYISKSRNYPALVYFSSNGHMYLVNDQENALCLIRSAVDIEHKINTKIYYEKEEKQFDDNITVLQDIPIDQINNTVENDNTLIVYNKANINDELYQYIQSSNIIPEKIKTDNIAVQKFNIKVGDNNVVLMADPNVEVHNVTHKEVKDICAKTDLQFTNQSFPSLIKKLKTNHYSAKENRAISKEIRASVFAESSECANCHNTLARLSEAHIDHIIPLGCGGSNERENLQVLCKPCHKEKTAGEQDRGYIKGSETESTFNSKVAELFNSPLAQTYAFVEHARKDVPKDLSSHPIYKYDINKCRKNILYNSEHDFCLFTVMDDIKVFDPSVNTIKPGRYYLETKLYMPTRGNGWYYHNTVQYLLDKKLICLENIKYVVYASLTVPRDYYNGFIDYIYKLLPEAQAKLAVNSMIGQFKLKDREFWKLLTITTDINTAYYYFIHYNATHINPVKKNDIIYYEVYSSYKTSDIETEGPIYQQIVEQELSCISLRQLLNQIMV
jgi:5-methylcytosine-specific restriction enzyme A